MADLAELRVTGRDEGVSQMLVGIKAKAEEVGASADKLKAAWSAGVFDSFTKGPALAVAGVIGGISTAAIGLGTYFVSLAKDTMTAQAALKSMSEVTGASVEWLSGVRTTAKLTGTEMDALGSGITKMAKNIETGGSETEKALKAIGLNIRDLQGLKSNEQFDLIARSLNNYADGAGKTAAAQLILGKSGAALLPFIKDYNDLSEVAVKVTAQQAAQADDLEKNIKRLTAAKEAWKKVVGAELVPVLDDVVKVLLRVQTETNGTLDTTKRLAADGTIKQWAQSAARSVAMLADILVTSIDVAKLVGLAFVAAGGDVAAFVTKVVSAVNPYNGALRAIADRTAAWAAEQRAAFNAAWEKGFNPGKFQQQIDAQFANSAAQAARDSRHFAEFGDTVGKVRKQITGLETDSKEKINALGRELDALFTKLNNHGDAEAAKEIALLTKALQTGAIGYARYADGVTLVINNSKSLKNIRDELVAQDAPFRAINEAAIRADETRVENMEKAVKSYRELIVETQTETRLLGLSNEERIIATALLKAQAAGVDTTTEAWARMAAELRKAVYDKSAQEQTLKNLEDTRRESERIWKGIGDDITQWIMSGFKNTRDLLKRMFETLVLRPMIAPIVGDITGGLQNILGGLGGGTGGGGVLGILGSLFGGGNTLGAFGGSASGAFQNVLASLFGTGGGLMEGIGSMIGGVSGGISGIFGGSILSGLGQLAGALGPIGMALGAVYSIAKMFDGANGTGLKFGRDAKGIYGDQAANHATFSNKLGNFAYEGDDANANGIRTIQAFVTRFNAEADALAAMLTPEQLAAVRDKIGKIRKEDWFKYDGDPGTAANKAITDLLKDVFGTAFGDVNQTIANIISGWTGSAEDLQNYIDKYIQLRAAIDAAHKVVANITADTQNDVSSILDQQSNNVLAAYRAQQNGLSGLLGISNDATDALGTLVTGMTSFRSAAVQMLVQIAQIKAQMSAMFGDTIRSLELSVLDSQGQYEYLQAEAQRLYAQALASTDPLEIQRLMQQVNADVNQAMGLLDPTQRAALVPEQIDRLRQINADMQQHMTDLSNVVTVDLTAALTSLSNKLDKVAEAQLKAAEKTDGAADKLNDAADKFPDTLHVDFTANVPGTATVEVGG